MREPWVHDGGVDSERRDLGRQRRHPALESELRRGVGAAELEADQARGRGDRDDVPRALLSHDRKDGAGDVHGADQARRQLPIELLWRQLLEVAGIEVGGVITSTSMRPNRSTVARTAVWASPNRVMSSLAVRRFPDSPSVSDRRTVSRPVATTACPAASAALAISTPIPRPAPVMNQTFCVSMVTVCGRARRRTMLHFLQGLGSLAT